MKLLIISMIFYIEGNAMFNITSPQETDLISELLEELVPENETLTIVTHTQLHLSMPKIFRLYMVFYMDKPSLFEANYFDYYLIYVAENITFSLYLESMKNSSYWHKHNSPLAKYLIIIYNIEQLDDLFYHTWMNDMLNIILLFYSDGLYKQITNNPYNTRSKCWELGQDLPNLNKHIVRNNLQRLNSSYLLDNSPKLFQNYQPTTKCDFVIGYITPTPLHFTSMDPKTPGLIVILSEFFKRKLNARISFRHFDFHGEFIRLGRIDNLENTLNSKNVDIIPLLIQESLFYRKLSCTRGYLYDTGYWIVAQPPKKSNFKLIVNTFPYSVWILIFLSSIIIFILYYSLLKDLWNCFYDIYIILLGGSVKLNLSSSSAKILILYLLLTLELRTFYVAELGSILTKPGYEEGVNSFNKLLSSNMSPFLYNITIQNRIYQEMEKLENLLSRAQVLDYATDASDKVQLVISNPNFAMPVYNFYLHLYPNLTALRHIVKFEGSYLNLQLVATFFTRKGHPLYKKINKIIDGSWEGGLHQVWWSNVNRFVFDREEESHIVLMLEHVSGAFYLLFGGYALSIVAFFFEILIRWCKNIFN